MKYRYTLEGIDCAHCAQEIEDALKQDERFENVILNFATSKLSFTAKDNEKMREIVEQKIAEVENGIKVKAQDDEEENNNISPLHITFIILGVVIAIITNIIPFPDILKTVFMIIAYIFALERVACVAFDMLFHKKVLDENTLIVISAVGAFLVGQRHEGLMVAVLYEIGKILENMAVHKTRKSVQALMDIKPEYANLKVDGGIESISPEKIKIGDIIVIKSGEKIPLDGIVCEGNAKIDSSALTGESKLVEVNEGSEVLSGCISVDGYIEVRVTKEYSESTVSQILNLIENATDRKAKTESTVSKFAKIYTPTILVLACVVAIFLPIVSSLTYQESIYRALIFLVISCPCAIAISVPLTYFSGIGRASKSGILVKGSDYLDGLKDIKQIVFDKTGTLTTGAFHIEHIESLDENITNEDILKIAAIGEKNSNHPIAKSIVSTCKEDVSMVDVDDYVEIMGKGISYQYNGKKIFVGNQKGEEKNGATVIVVSIDDVIVGKIFMKDSIKEKALEVMNDLKKNNIQVAMFTGDKRDVAESVGNELGMKDIHAEMLPTQKYEELEKYLKEISKVAFVGDGINDAPVLTLADIGIAMGGIGSSSSIEAADVVIMTDELSKIPEAIRISKKNSRIIQENLIFAIGMKLLFLVLSVLGLASMWMAVFADVGVTLITILNSLRNFAK